MKKRIRTALALVVSMTTPLAGAHPGPHIHTSIDNAAPHADLGWPALLMLAVVAAVVIIWRRRERRH